MRSDSIIHFRCSGRSRRKFATLTMSYSLKSIYATLPRTTRGMPIVINGDPKGKNFLYTNGTSVIIRDIENPSIADVYTEHSVQTTVAQYSPSGFYIASGDVSGKVRIWDTTQSTHILKNEFQPLGGIIKDISWSGDNQRIAVGGDGRERFGHVFNAETGTSVGEIMGHHKSINAVDFKPTRPFRVATASEDNHVCFFEGPPFKFKCTISDHERFVNALRYARDGEIFISCGADGKAFIYDGKTAEKKGELGGPAHKGGIYALSFSPDSKQVLTCSGDKTAKIWDIETGAAVTEFVLGSQLEDMQVGCLWQGDYLLSVSLSGHINYLDKNNPSSPMRILKGHNKPITSLAVSEDRSTVFTGSSDGIVCHWNAKTGENDLMTGKGHTNQVQDMAIADDTLTSCGLDDTAIFSSVSEKSYGDRVKLPSQPKGLAVSSGGLAVFASVNDVTVMRNQKIIYTQKVDFEPFCAAIHPGQSEVAVGGFLDHKVHLYDLSGDTLSEKNTFRHLDSVTGLAYSPDGAFLAACDSNRKVVLYQLPDYTTKISTEWSYHSAKVNTLCWTQDSRHVASGALDTNLIVWNPESKTKYNVIKGAHPMSQVTKINWLDDKTLISVGQDSNLRIWDIVHK